MADIISPLSVITIMLLIISVPVDVRLSYDESLVIDLNFMLFGAHFSHSERKSSKKRHIGLMKRIRSARRLNVWLPSALGALDFLISHSRIVMDSFSYTTSGEDYASAIKRYSGVSAITNTVFAYLKSRAIVLEAASDTPSFFHNKDIIFDKISFDVRFQLIFIHIPFAIAVFLFDIIKKNIFTRSKKNVRKQNE